jgi:hypothetical protein
VLVSAELFFMHFVLIPILIVSPLHRPNLGTLKTSVLFLSKFEVAEPLTSTLERERFGADDFTDYSNGLHTLVAVNRDFNGDAALLNSCIFAMFQLVVLLYYNYILIK